MLGLFEALLMEITAFGPDLLLLFGTPELSRNRRLLTVRRGQHAELVEA